MQGQYKGRQAEKDAFLEQVKARKLDQTDEAEGFHTIDIISHKEKTHFFIIILLALCSLSATMQCMLKKHSGVGGRERRAAQRSRLLWRMKSAVRVLQPALPRSRPR
jgi:hypothetical protein